MSSHHIETLNWRQKILLSSQVSATIIGYPSCNCNQCFVYHSRLLDVKEYLIHTSSYSMALWTTFIKRDQPMCSSHITILAVATDLTPKIQPVLQLCSDLMQNGEVIIRLVFYRNVKSEPIITLSFLVKPLGCIYTLLY